MITGFFASILAFFYVGLSMHVIRTRRRLKVALLDGGQQELTRAIRAQGNLAEYTPITLFLMVGLEQQNAHPYAIYILGFAYLSGRCMHAYSLLRREVTSSDKKVDFRFRVTGMAITFTTIIGLAILNLMHFMFSFILD